MSGSESEPTIALLPEVSAPVGVLFRTNLLSNHSVTINRLLPLSVRARETKTKDCGNATWMQDSLRDEALTTLWHRPVCYELAVMISIRLIFYGTAVSFPVMYIGEGLHEVRL